MTVSNFNRGSISNLNYPTVYDYGIVGYGKYTPYTHKLQYQYWTNMLKRVLQKHKHTKAYIGCSISKEWIYFQNFCEWFDKNYYTVNNDRMCLDKDIKVKNNKIYSADTCIFVPNRINTCFNHNSSKDIHLVKSGYVVEVSDCDNSKIRYSKIKTYEEALYIWCTEKQKHILEILSQYNNQIPKEIYDIVSTYFISYND